jgi:hypothetical protein
MRLMGRDRMEDSNDPTGITATLYRIKVLQRLKGAVASISVRSENTSARFPMDTGEDYLLFLNKDGKTYFVNSCGNSAIKKQAATVIAELASK